MSETRYKCQYQKGSDKCKYAACRHPISEGTLKIAKIATKSSPTNWFHIECLFRSFKKSKEGGIKDAEKQIKGFKEIRQRDKDLIKSYITDSPDKSSSSSSSDSSSGSTESSSATAEYKNKKKSNKSSSTSSSDTSSSTSTSEDTKKKRRRSKSPTKSSSAKSSPSKKSPKKSPKKTPTKKKEKKEKFVPPPTPDGPRTFKCPVPACPLDGFEGRGPTQNAQQNDLKRHLNKHINGKLKGRPTPSQLSSVRLRKCNGCRLCVALRKEYCLSCKKNASSEEDEKPKKAKAKKAKVPAYPKPPSVTLKRKRADDDEPGNGATKKKREDLKADDTPAEGEKPEKDEASSEHSDN